MDSDAGSRIDIQPFIEPEIAKLIGLLIRLTAPQRVLEIGTGIAYSTIWIGQALRETGGTLTTIDNHPRTIVEARKNIEEAGLSDIVEVRYGDAQQQISSLKREGLHFGVVFQDCGKSVYNIVYEDVYDLLEPGGLLISDDTLMQFDPAVRKGLGAYIEAYNERLFSDPRFYSVLLPVGQGIALSWKK